MQTVCISLTQINKSVGPRINPCGFEGRIWDLIVSVPDHCLSFYFVGRRI